MKMVTMSRKRVRKGKKVLNNKSREQVKKEFDEFAKNVSRLEMLRRELNSLDTKGFEVEVNLIKAKLHDVGAVHEIERDIRKLGERIKHKVARRSVRSKAARELLKKSKSLEHDHRLMGRRIQELEGRIAKAKKPSKKQLSREEIGDVKSIPKLEKELQMLRKDFHEHTKRSNIKIDTSVGTLVDTNFDEFVNNIKGEISEKLEAKKVAMESQLETEMEESEKILANRYKALAGEFHDRYKERVQNELKREVKRRFDEEVQRKMDEERKKVVSELLKENAKRLHVDKRKIIEDLEREYTDKEAMLKKHLDNEKANLSREMQEVKLKREELIRGEKSNKEELKKKVEELNRSGNELRKKLDEERKEQLKKEREILKKEIREIGIKKGELTKEVKRKREELGRKVKELGRREEELRKKLNSEFASKVRELKNNLHLQLQKETEDVQKKKEGEMNRALERKEEEMRRVLELEYQEKLKKEVKVREAQLEKKKMELEHKIVEHAKEMFK